MDKKDAYDYEPEIGGGKFLSLTKKDQVITIRIVSTPKHKKKHWLLDASGKKTKVNCTEDDNCPYCGEAVPSKEKIKRKEEFAWLVIDREDGEIKMYTATTSVYLSIKELKDDSDWGDPTQYDIKVKRTEEPGMGYYKVTPVGKGMGDITKEEKELVGACTIDLVTELEGGKDTNTFGSGNLETAPDDDIVVPDDMLDEKENVKEAGIEDDMPF